MYAKLLAIYAETGVLAYTRPDACTYLYCGVDGLLETQRKTLQLVVNCVAAKLLRIEVIE